MGLSSSIVVVIVVVLSATTILVVVGNWFMNRRHHRERRQHEVPNLVMPLDSPSPHRMSPAFAQQVIIPPAPRPSPRTVAIITPPPGTQQSDIDYNEDDLFLGEDDVFPEEDTPADATDEETVTDTGPIDTTGARTAAPPQVRFAQQHPEDGTLEFLPGRLEVIGGQDQGQEIHFVRPRDPGPPVVTFGRREGPRHRHVQLLDRTVSRTHARMTWANEHWTLENLSKTNPLSLNGAMVAEGGPPVTLGEGDRIDMGAVIFVFRER